ncbi:hypothetical protein HDU83_006562 [Entophlyctis luteolus]|nr:hypothetical protein HDU83_006562 [Entophlyctis luteolus]
MVDEGVDVDSLQETMRYFTRTDAQKLRLYSYKSVDKSFIATKILNPYWWSVIIDFVPGWVAPNLITLTGFLCVLANVVILLYYSPDLVAPCPSWCYVSFAVGLFVYQSLDAIDGKQARRTGSSGPLGELFDHGCDALNTGLATLLGINALGLGHSWWSIFTTMCCIANFYLSTWEEYYTEILYLSEFSGPIEGVLTMCVIFFATTIWGTEIWSTPIGQVLPGVISDHISFRAILDFPVNKAIVVSGTFAVVFNVITSTINVQNAIASNPESAAKAKNCSPAVSLLPFPVLAAAVLSYPAVYASAVISEGDAFVPFLVTVSCVCGQQVGQVIVAHVSKRVFPLRESVAAGIAVCVGGHLGVAVGALVAAASRRDAVFADVLDLTGGMMWSIAAVAAGVYLVWFTSIVSDLCEIFDIYCLAIKRKTDPAEKNSPVKKDVGAVDLTLAGRTRSGRKRK